MKAAFRLASLLVAFSVFPAASSALSPPPPPEASISFSDTFLDFGEVEENTGSSQKALVITNTGSVDADIVPSVPPSPFSILANTCSTLTPGESCEITFGFAPSGAGDYYGEVLVSFSLYSPPETLYLKGRGIVNQLINLRPTAPVLKSPENKEEGVDIDVSFSWNASYDPEGEPVSYDIYLCTDQNFIGCEAPQNTDSLYASASKINFFFLISGGVLMGFISQGHGGRRKLFTLFFIFLACLAVLGLWACGDYSSSNNTDVVHYSETSLLNNTQYFWKVTAKDPSGNRTDSSTWNFTTR